MAPRKKAETEKKATPKKMTQNQVIESLRECAEALPNDVAHRQARKAIGIAVNSLILNR